MLVEGNPTKLAVFVIDDHGRWGCYETDEDRQQAD